MWAGVRGEAETYDFGVDFCVAGLCGFQGFESEHGGAFADGHAVAVSREGAALGGGDDSHGVPGAEEAEGERGFVASGDGGGDHAAADHLEGEADGVGSGGAGGGDVEGGAGDLLVDGDVAGSGGGHCADDGEGMDAGVFSVETHSFGLFGLTASAGTAYDYGDFFGGVVLGELGFGGGLAGGYDGKVRGAVGSSDDAGFEVLAGVKVLDGGGLGEAEALIFATGSFGVGREGGDSGLAGEEGVAEVLDCVADWSDAA